MTFYCPKPSSKIVNAIVRYVSRTEGVCAKSIMGKSRFPEHCRARRMVILRLWRMRRYSKNGIAMAMGLDHTTIVYHTMRRDHRLVKNRRDVAAKMRSIQS